MNKFGFKVRDEEVTNIVNKFLDDTGIEVYHISGAEQFPYVRIDLEEQEPPILMTERQVICMCLRAIFGTIDLSESEYEDIIKIVKLQQYLLEGGGDNVINRI